MPVPTGVIAVAGGDGSNGFPSAIVGWENNGSDSYNVYASKSGGAFQSVGSTVSGLTHLRLDGLTSGTTYQFKVRGVDSGLESSDSITVSVTTESPVAGPVTLLVASFSVTPTTILLRWNYQAETVVVYRSADGGITFRLWSIGYYPDALYDEGLTPGTTYIYRYCNGASFEAVTEVSYTTTARGVGAPIEPGNLTVTPDIDGIHLAWTNPSGAEVQVERRYWASGGVLTAYTWTSLITTTAGATSYVDTTAAARRGVYYRVRSKSGIIYSDYVTPTQKMISTPSPYRGGITVSAGHGTAEPVLTDALLDALGPGDTLEWHWDGSTPTFQKILLSACGTPGNPITFKGIRHTNGSRPVIDGTNATGVGGYSVSQDAYLIGVTPKSIDAAGYKPNHIRITGLEIRNARPPGTFTPTGGGAPRTYADNTAGVFIKTALNVTVDDCYIHDIPNLIRQGSGKYDRYYPGTPTVYKCVFDRWGYDNGKYADQWHGLYLDGPNASVIDCEFIDTYPGTGGIQCKLRCPNALIQGNIFRANTKAIDVLSSDCSAIHHILRDSNFFRSRVVGNVIVMGPNFAHSRMSLFGFDGSTFAEFSGSMRGPHYVHGNTIVAIRSPASSRTFMYMLRSNGSSSPYRHVGFVEWNNVVANIGIDGADPYELRMMEGNGTIQHGVSTFSDTPTDFGRTGITLGRLLMMTSGVPDLHMVDILGGDYRPGPASPMIDAYVQGPADAVELNTAPLGAAQVQIVRDIGAYAEAEPPPTFPVILWPFRIQRFGPTRIAAAPVSDPIWPIGLRQFGVTRTGPPAPPESEPVWPFVIQRVSSIGHGPVSVPVWPFCIPKFGPSRPVEVPIYSIRIDRFAPSFLSSTTVPVFTSRLSAPLTLPGTDLVVSIPEASAPGTSWSVTADTARPSDLVDVERRLLRLPDGTLDVLFGYDDVEPYKTLRALWESHEDIPIRIGGVLLAMIYRAESRRVGSGG